MTAPNIVIIMADQQSPHVLGCAGDPVVRTPSLDRLAAEGVRFTSAYCGNPLCVPSRATFMTGQSSSAIQVWTNFCSFSSMTPTFAHALAIAGYDTVLCGRMHFIGADTRHGFTERPIGDSGGWPGWPPQQRFRGLPPNIAGMSKIATQVAGPGRTEYQEYDRAVFGRAVQWLRARAESGNPKPFCLVVSAVLPHNPYIAPLELWEEYMEQVTIPETPARYFETLHPAVRLWRQAKGVDDLTPEEVRCARAGYYGLVTLADAHVGEVVRALEETGLRERTAIFYTSDHGEMAGELGMWWKHSLYEGSVGVPLIASWPGHFPAGHVVDEPVSLIDLAPTLAALGGGPPLPHATGRVLLPLLRGEPAPAGAATWPREVYAENVPGGPGGRLPPARMVRRGRWKLVHHHGFERPQLFDLHDDPHEVNDLGADPACAEVRAELLDLALKGWDGAWVQAMSRRHGEEAAYIGRWAQAAKPEPRDVFLPDQASLREALIFPERSTRFTIPMRWKDEWEQQGRRQEQRPPAPAGSSPDASDRAGGR